MKKKELKAKIAELEKQRDSAQKRASEYIRTVEYLRVQMEKGLTALPEVTRHILKEALEETRPKSFTDMMGPILKTAFEGTPSAVSEEKAKEAGCDGSSMLTGGGTLCR